MNQDALGQFLIETVMQFVPPIAGGVTAITILIVIYVMFNLHVIEDK